MEPVVERVNATVQMESASVCQGFMGRHAIVSGPHFLKKVIWLFLWFQSSFVLVEDPVVEMECAIIRLVNACANQSSMETPANVRIIFRKIETFNWNDLTFLVRFCPQNGTCSFKGQCNIITGSCECYPGYRGDTCQCKMKIFKKAQTFYFILAFILVKLCPGDGTCSNNGKCDFQNGACLCQEKYYGNTCQCNLDLGNFNWIYNYTFCNFIC